MTAAIVIVALALIAGAAAEIIRKRSGDGAKSGLAAALDMIRGVALKFILQAEQTLGSGTGQFKKADVLEIILNSAFFLAIPAGVRNLITYDMLSKIIDEICGLVFKPQVEGNAAVKRLLSAGVTAATGFVEASIPTAPPGEPE